MQLAVKRLISHQMMDHGVDLIRSETRSVPDMSVPIVHGFISRVIASVYEIDVAHLLAPTRGTAMIALARQVAMYLAHVGCGLTLTEVGRQFGRDRTTVAHACEVVEERREDESFDQMIELLEQSVAMLQLNEGEGQW